MILLGLTGKVRNSFVEFKGLWEDDVRKEAREATNQRQKQRRTELSSLGVNYSSFLQPLPRGDVLGLTGVKRGEVGVRWPSRVMGD